MFQSEGKAGSKTDGRNNLSEGIFFILQASMGLFGFGGLVQKMARQSGERETLNLELNK